MRPVPIVSWFYLADVDGACSRATRHNADSAIKETLCGIAFAWHSAQKYFLCPAGPFSFMSSE